ncbi:hypothetical protein TREMEDRAFT_63900 [Tremella mesenterica DSM 1558]|uniref:uncharacterized protein n=1 Tax=Tremella mesenterica (strain ATCC 24925 / CBS 8224 / DSM 1558 / NBRC 9311 / NRRL Y-6157 / RJB 2259-6 / UBC 559-6) TaxID=578456 RepID=UPI0003F49EAB|nr:uncharacterized protein TREMEDRAFT_63900 [Tremella mesenterica DSM 1558]EIW68014.1 hypothetical protein TREMEDRAFT_63900 [Tremella mesenterica DSM 1558]
MSNTASTTARPLASKLLPSIEEWNKKFVAQEYGKPNETIGLSVWHLTRTLQSILEEESLHPGTVINLLEEEERYDSVPADITRVPTDQDPIRLETLEECVYWRYHTLTLAEDWLLNNCLSQIRQDGKIPRNIQASTDPKYATLRTDLSTCIDYFFAQLKESEDDTGKPLDPNHFTYEFLLDGVRSHSQYTLSDNRPLYDGHTYLSLRRALKEAFETAYTEYKEAKKLREIDMVEATEGTLAYYGGDE